MISVPFICCHSRLRFSRKRRENRAQPAFICKTRLTILGTCFPWCYFSSSKTPKVSFFLYPSHQNSEKQWPPTLESASIKNGPVRLSLLNIRYVSKIGTASISFQTLADLENGEREGGVEGCEGSPCTDGLTRSLWRASFCNADNVLCWPEIVKVFFRLRRWQINPPLCE